MEPRARGGRWENYSGLGTLALFFFFFFAWSHRCQPSPSPGLHAGLVRCFTRGCAREVRAQEPNHGPQEQRPREWEEEGEMTRATQAHTRNPIDPTSDAKMSRLPQHHPFFFFFPFSSPSRASDAHDALAGRSHTHRLPVIWLMPPNHIPLTDILSPSPTPARCLATTKRPKKTNNDKKNKTKNKTARGVQKEETSEGCGAEGAVPGRGAR